MCKEGFPSQTAYASFWAREMWPTEPRPHTFGSPFPDCLLARRLWASLRACHRPSGGLWTYVVFSLNSKALEDARRMVKRKRVNSEMPSINFNLLSCASTPVSSLAVPFKSESEKKENAMKRVLMSWRVMITNKATAGLPPSGSRHNHSPALRQRKEKAMVAQTLNFSRVTLPASWEAVLSSISQDPRVSEFAVARGW